MHIQFYTSNVFLQFIGKKKREEEEKDKKYQIFCGLKQH